MSVDLLIRGAFQHRRQRLQRLTTIKLENEELLTHEGLEFGDLEMRVKLFAACPQALEVTLVGDGSAAQNIDHRAHHRGISPPMIDALLELCLAAGDETLVLGLDARTPPHRLAVHAQPDHGLQPTLTVDFLKHTLSRLVAHLLIGLQGRLDLIGQRKFHLPKGVIGTHLVTIGLDALRQYRDRHHQRVAVGEQLVAQAYRVHAPNPARRRRRHHRPQPRLDQHLIDPQVDLGHPRHGREAALVFGMRLDDGVDVFDAALAELEQVIPVDMHCLGGTARGGFRYRGLVEPRRQHIDIVHIGGELSMLLARHAARDEDPQMTGGVMLAIDDGLAIGNDIVRVAVEVADPAQRLRRRRDVIALRAEHHDG